MKRYWFINFILISAIFIGSCSYKSPDEMNLSGTWSFCDSDSIQYKDEGYDDSACSKVIVPQRLDKQEIEFKEGKAWYRKKVYLKIEGKSTPLGIYFSNIADADEVYFNGILIGKSGDFKKNGNITPHFSKVYLIPQNLINNDDKKSNSSPFCKKIWTFHRYFCERPCNRRFL